MAKQKPETPIFLSCYKRVQERSGARTSEHDRVATRKAAWILRAWSLRIQLHSAWQHALCRQHRQRFFRSRPPKKEKLIAASSRKRPPIRKHLKLAPNSCTIETLKRGWGGAERRGEGSYCTNQGELGRGIGAVSDVGAGKLIEESGRVVNRSAEVAAFRGSVGSLQIRAQPTHQKIFQQPPHPAALWWI